ncbi:MAG: SDR family oxidoreductase [Burkholderiaceae bacterium]
MARRFAELGARLVICGRRAEPLEATAAALRNELDAEIELHRCDLRSADAVEAMMDAIWASAPVDVLVNNAAATFVARSEALSARALDAVLAPTLHGALHCTLATGQLMSGPRAGRDPGERVPLGRVGEHAELANLASYLVSDQAAYVTGEMVMIDGGAHLRGSGAEDLLAWTEADWSALRSARARPDKPRG